MVAGGKKEKDSFRAKAAPLISPGAIRWVKSTIETAPIHTQDDALHNPRIRILDAKVCQKCYDFHISKPPPHIRRFIYDNFVIYSTVNKGLPTSIKHKMRARKTLFILLGIFFSAMILLVGAAFYIYAPPPLWSRKSSKKPVSSATGALLFPFNISATR